MTLEEDLQKALENKSKGNQELAALQERVAKGESLGNPIKDYLFVCYGTADLPIVEEKLKNLSDKIQAHHGQQVMAMYIKSELLEEGGCFSSPLYNKEITGQQLGVLSGELTFNLENGGIVLPTDKYVQKGEEPFIFQVENQTWKLKEGGITIPGYHYGSSYFVEGKLPRPEILFGDEVELYFSAGKTSFEHYLETRSEEWKDHLLSENKRIDGEYLSGLNLLGVEVPQRFQEKYDAQLQQRKEKILEKIQDQDQVQHYLTPALELKLHQEEREIELQPGIKMNVPEYIRAQCERYKIKISE